MTVVPLEPPVLGFRALPAPRPISTELLEDDKRTRCSATTSFGQPQKAAYLPTGLTCLEPAHAVLGLNDEATAVLEHQCAINEDIPQLGHGRDFVLATVRPEIAEYLTLESIGRAAAASQASVEVRGPSLPRRYRERRGDQVGNLDHASSHVSLRCGPSLRTSIGQRRSFSREKAAVPLIVPAASCNGQR